MDSTHTPQKNLNELLAPNLKLKSFCFRSYTAPCMFQTKVFMGEKTWIR